MHIRTPASLRAHSRAWRRAGMRACTRTHTRMYAAWDSVCLSCLLISGVFKKGSDLCDRSQHGGKSTLAVSCQTGLELHAQSAGLHCRLHPHRPQICTEPSAGPTLAPLPAPVHRVAGKRQACTQLERQMQCRGTCGSGALSNDPPPAVRASKMRCACATEEERSGVVEQKCHKCMEGGN